MPLEINNINVYYDDFHVLNDVSITAEDGECIALLGSNGAGKTTLINTVSGLNKTTTGDIIFNGKSVKDIPAHEVVELGIIQVPEGRRLFPNLSVRENLLVGAYSKRAREGREERMAYVLDMIPALKNKLSRAAGSMSGGEQQMCAIGRGLMSKPELLMMDEPSLGLAPKIVEEMFEIIEKIMKTGTSILLVEQNVNMSLEISKHAYVLESGRISLSGTAKELESNPKLRESYLGI
ncbi:MAG: ABC transporter ATP-binding protein [Eubacteriales bacterium]|nr:ABC transporter ATP-binding protein [Eubacteriales bacterium]MDD4324047.1 ABC transporter ATP-binding protein [Eubacteriales bacterium]MDD4541513.1 ABC transporter ATP-binding protein [Eubacteriales bacterium]